MIHRRLCKHIVECESARGARFLTGPPARSCIACRAATPAPPRRAGPSGRPSPPHPALPRRSPPRPAAVPARPARPVSSSEAAAGGLLSSGRPPLPASGRGCPGGALNPLGWGLPGSTLAGGPRVGAFAGRCWPAAPVGGAVAGWSWPGAPLGEASANQCWPATPIGVPFCLQCWPATPRGVPFCFQCWPATPRGNFFSA